MKFNIQDERLEILYNLLQACTFNQLTDGLSNEPDKAKLAISEKVQIDSITEKLKMHYNNTNVQLEHAQKSKQRKLDVATKRLKAINTDLETAEEEKENLEGVLKAAQQAMNASKRTATVKRLEKAIKTLKSDVEELETQVIPAFKAQCQKEVKAMEDKLAKADDEETYNQLSEKL